MGSYRYILMTIAVTLTAAMPALGRVTDETSTSFSAMTVEEVSALLAQCETSAAWSASAKDAARDASAAPLLLPVVLTAEDMVSKVYGVISPSVSRDECKRQSQQLLCLTPEDDQGALWLDSSSGYGINYYGMFPDVSAMARYSEGDGSNRGVEDFGFFFLFPYTQSSRQQCVRNQADFCGSLLQEMADVGLSMDLNTATDDLFEAVGDYKGSLVDVRLLDEQANDGAGRYILILSVEPNAY